jgi:ferric-dicitrate binding protein FerR (iron transport regulator)
MATKTSGARGAAIKAGRAAAGARENPYVQRMVEDPELRENVRQAFEAARHAYKRMSNGKAPTKALLEDKKLQRDLRQATDSLREAADQLRGKRRKRRHRGRRILLLLVVGAAVVLAVNEDARKALLDKIFGAEEEFEYSSTTSPT